MSQKNLEILGEEWITPSLVESEYSGLILREDSIIAVDSIDSRDSITAVDSIDSEDYLAPVNFIGSEDFLGSENSLPLVDSLTGMANNPTVNARWPPEPLNLFGVTVLKNAGLRIERDFFSLWEKKAKVTVTIQVELDDFDKMSNLVLKSRLVGMNGNIFKGNSFKENSDNLFKFHDQIISQEGTYTFSASVPYSLLNVNRLFFGGVDEIAAKVSLVSPPFPGYKQATTPTIRGYF